MSTIIFRIMNLRKF